MIDAIAFKFQTGSQWVHLPGWYGNWRGATDCGCGPWTAPRERIFTALMAQAYKQRNTIERCINRLKQWRGIATRYEKTATIHLAGLHIAGIFMWSA
ncbi:DDE family transposase [Streptomyces sp. BK208]|nr:DDE family transposase [Streptomyces sp. BK208]